MEELAPFAALEVVSVELGGEKRGGKMKVASGAGN